MSQAESNSVACIVVNYFCAQQTLEAVRSFADQCPHGQIVVVDNSTTPKELDMLRQGLPPRTLLIQQPKNSGFAVACNTALTHCDKEFVLLLNPDAILLPGCIEQLVQCLHKHKHLAAASPLQFWDRAQTWLLPPAWLPTGIGLWALSAAVKATRSACRLSYAYRRLALSLWMSKSKEATPQRALSGGAMLIRKSALRPSGLLFDPRYFMYYEDSDLCMRLRREGWKLAIANNAHVVHEWEHSTSKIQMMEESRALYFSSNLNGSGEWQKRLDRVDSKPNQDNPLLGEILAQGTPSLDVPAPWQDEWLLEVSPSPLLIPAMGHFGSGPIATLNWNLFKRMGQHGRIYLRLGPIHKQPPSTLVFVVETSK